MLGVLACALASVIVHTLEHMATHYCVLVTSHTPPPTHTSSTAPMLHSIGPLL